MHKIILAGISLLLLSLSFRYPESFIVNGKVTDDAGNPLAGVQVQEQGTSNRTSTDLQGTFTIAVNNQTSRLIFSLSGFAEKDLALQGKKMLHVILVAKTVSRLEPGKKKRVLMAPADQEYLQKSRSITGIYQSPSVMYKKEMYNMAPRLGRQDVQSYVDTDPRQERRRYNGNFNTEDYDGIVENRFLSVTENPLSTFSIDVDAASYSNVRRYLQMGQLPPAGAVRIEEMINYFHYDYPQPVNEHPFSINTEIAECPWNNLHRLVLVGMQGKKIPTKNLPPSNIVFLIDVSGSMMPENKLPLVKSSMKLLVDQLREQDRVSIVVYAGNAGLVLPSTSGSRKMEIRDAIDKLEAGGSTAGGAGIKLAYSTATNNFLKNGNNRVILCTDGDFNVGVSSDAELEQMIEEKRKSGVFLTVLGYGMGNYKDNKMQKLANKGNGNHAYIDGLSEAKKVLVNEFGGTLFTIAKDVKLQVEFNPSKVQSYRLIGYENRMLNKEDFNNDQKDAGELGSGHTVTALYEVIPAGVQNAFLEKVDPLKYQQEKKPSILKPENNGEIMTIKFRYKKPDAELSQLIVHPVLDKKVFLSNTSSNFRFAAAVAQFGMLLRNSEFKQASSFSNAWQLAQAALGNDEEGYRSEFLRLLKNAEASR